jgi:glycine cleavage system P protein (glycine dehydrogenase) subunit 1
MLPHNKNALEGKMPKDGAYIHPYIPNTSPSARRHLLDAVGVASAAELYDAVPAALKLKRSLDLPPPIASEHGLRKHVEGILAKNKSCAELLNFRGAGCWQHYVPAICDEINRRGEFLTAYAGWSYSDHGKLQAIFEYQSLVGELVGLDVVSTPTYDMGAAANSAVAMACRLTGRQQVLVPASMDRARLSQMRGFTKPFGAVVEVAIDRKTGELDRKDLAARLTADTAAVYLEVPSSLGIVDAGAPDIVKRAHAKGALAVIGVDPSTLGVLEAPGNYGADLVVGELQPLGMHMNGGGGQAGFIASRDEPRFVDEYPSFLISLTQAAESGAFGFGVGTLDRTSYHKRHAATDYYGTTQWLWGITAGVYLSLMGPQGMLELGEGIIQRAAYAAERLGRLKGVKAPYFTGASFKEFVVNFDRTGKTVAAINKRLLRQGIIGGKDLSHAFPALGQSALFCVTEIHDRAAIDRLAAALKEAVS